MGLLKDIGPGPAGLDTSVFIFYLEENPRYLPVVGPVFAAVARGSLEAATSAITLLETLVAPLRKGNAVLADRYERLLTRSRGLRLVGMDVPVLRAAAHLRAVTRVKTPDALHLASALAAGCSAFVTHDRELPEIPGLRILQLRDYAPPPSSVHERRR